MANTLDISAWMQTQDNLFSHNFVIKFSEKSMNEFIDAFRINTFNTTFSMCLCRPTIFSSQIPIIDPKQSHY